MASQTTYANTEIQTVVPGPGPLFTTSTIGNQLSIKTTIPGRAYQFAGIKSLTSGFSFTPCTTSDKGYCLFSVSDTTAATPSLAGYTANPTFKLCLDAVGGKSSCEKTTIGSRFAYITNNSNAVSTITQCKVNSVSGALTDCVDQQQGLAGTGGREITLNPSGKIIYTADNGFTAPISYCPISPETGAVGDCLAVTATDVPNSANDGIAFNLAGTLIYLANQNDNKVYKCNVLTTGDVPNCDGGAVLNGATAIHRLALNPTGTLLY